MGASSSDKDLFIEEARAANLPAPANIPSQEENYYREPQLRWEPRSPEESTSSDKDWLCRSWWLDGCVCSDKDPFTEEERTVNLPAPANIPSQEKDYYRKPQLRREPRSPEESTSSYKACLRRSWRLDRCGSSDKDPLTEEERAANLPAPANIPSQEEMILPVTPTPASAPVHRR